MKWKALVLSSLVAAGSGLAGTLGCGQTGASQGESEKPEIALPAPKTQGEMSVEEALAKRRSIRQYHKDQLTLEQLGQLAWAAQGITNKRGFRTAPSAGATYPLELYLVTNDGVFRYLPAGHKLQQLSDQDLRRELAAAALEQEWVRFAPLDIVITAVYERTRRRYRDRAERYVILEAGHAAQNIHLQAVALGLGSVPVGAFRDERVSEVLALTAEEAPLYIIPVGVPL